LKGKSFLTISRTFNSFLSISLC